MSANRSFFSTMALAFVLVLVGVACTESASSDPESFEPEANGALAAEAPSVVEESHEATETHAEEESHEATEANAEEESHEATEAHAEEESHDPNEDGRVIEVTMSEFVFDPLTVQVTTGETVTFVVTNVGVVEHEFRLSNEHRIEEHLASGHAGHGEEASHHGDGDIVLLLPAGETGEVTVTFPSDATVYTHTACLIPGHYEAGMGGAIGYTA